MAVAVEPERQADHGDRRAAGFLQIADDAIEKIDGVDVRHRPMAGAEAAVGDGVVLQADMLLELRAGQPLLVVGVARGALAHVRDAVHLSPRFLFGAAHDGVGSDSEGHRGDAQPVPAGAQRYLDEAESLALLAAAGITVVEHRLCRSEIEARAAFRALGPKVVVKGCSASMPHKTEQGLVRLGVTSEDEAARLCREFLPRLPAGDGVLVARQVAGRRELALGARLDPCFGPVVMVGDGGIYLEALKDFRLLLPPFGEADVLAALAGLRIALLLGGLRGQPALDARAFASMAVHLGEAMRGWEGRVASVDVNPVMVLETGGGALAVDALVERADACAKAG